MCRLAWRGCSSSATSFPLKASGCFLWVVIVAGCRSVPAEIEVWAGSAITIDRGGDDSRDHLAPLPRRVFLEGAIQETLSFELAMRPGERIVRGPRLKVSPLVSSSGTIPPEALQLFRMHPVEVGPWPGWHIASIPASQREFRPLDALVPIGSLGAGMPASLATGVAYYFWVDLLIPKGTAAGDYTGRIEVLGDGKVLGGIDLAVSVWPIVLPDEADVFALAELDHAALFTHGAAARTSEATPEPLWEDRRSAELEALLGSTLRLLSEHRLTAVLPALQPVMGVDVDGRLLVDWSRFDAIVERSISGRWSTQRRPARAWPLPTWRTAEHGTTGLASGDLSSSFAHQFAVESVRHFHERGWADRAYYPILQAANSAEPSAGAEVSPLVTAALARAGIPLLFRRSDKRGTTLDPPAEGSGVNPGPMNIEIAPAKQFDRRFGSIPLVKPGRMWLEPDPPSTGTASVFGGNGQARLLGWQTASMGVEAIFLGQANHWPAGRTPSPEECLRYDPSVLLYPGQAFGLSEPVASVRLKKLRRGLQDAAFLRLLREHGLERIAWAVRDAIVGAAPGTFGRRRDVSDQWIRGSDEAKTFDLARRIMAAELAAAAYGESAGLAAASTRQSDWRRFRTLAPVVGLHVEGARVRATGIPTKRMTEIELSVAVENHRAELLDGTVDALFPGAWSSDSARIEIDGMDGYSTRRVLFRARSDLRHAVTGGTIDIPLSSSAAGGSARTQARVAMISALPLREGGYLTIDGDLSDWPPASSNAAEKFLSIAPSVEVATSADSRTPRHATWAFLLRDDRHLYVGVNCQTEAGDQDRAATRKTVRYENMIPVGEELVELLVDPSNLGTDDPDELYHVVIKRSGADLAERGVGIVPRSGTHTPWAVDIEVATQSGSDRWTAEVRIPLSAFEGAATRGTIWGFNVTRFDAASQEYSTWSGATSHAYAPASLGNLYLP
ncbi:MAG: hypothetical protein AABZ12_04980 [Planctomycetota bacterium]